MVFLANGFFVLLWLLLLLLSMVVDTAKTMSRKFWRLLAPFVQENATMVDTFPYDVRVLTDEYRIYNFGLARKKFGGRFVWIHSSKNYLHFYPILAHVPQFTC